MILVTGASGGIGGAIVPDLLKIDAVLGLYNSTPPKQEQTERLSFERLDVTNAHDIRSFVDKCKKRLVRLTVLHLAALKKDGLLVQFEESDWDAIINLNLKGNFLLMKCLLPIMMEQKWGRIIHISSVAALRGAAGTAAYGVSKAALHGLSRAIAKEYGRFNITSNVLDLGYFEVGMIDDLTEDTRKKLINEIPARKLGKPLNIANAVEFLIKSEFVNGAVVNIDGGV